MLMSFEPRQLIHTDGSAILVEHFLDAREASHMFTRLLEELAWRSEHYKIYGKTVAAPRLVCWYGEREAVYSYSGITHRPHPWHPQLLELKGRIEQFCGHSFNSVLANLYRDGSDSMGWHADKEPELGGNPYIASLSLGAGRLFKFRHNKTKQTVDVRLPGGSLLLMGGALQHHWRHCLPKTKQAVAPRINLTFRNILSGSNSFQR
jgi:alkylated DNA repair dioxygenase AlkB